MRWVDLRALLAVATLAMLVSVGFVSMFVQAVRTPLSSRVLVQAQAQERPELAAGSVADAGRTSRRARAP